MSDTVLDSVHDDLEAYVLGALDRDDENGFVSHLNACTSCRDGVVSYVPVTRALRSVPLATPPPMPQLGAGPVTPLRRSFIPPYAYAAAAALVLLLGGLWFAFSAPNGDQQLVAVAGMMADGPRQAQILGDGVRGRVIIGRRNKRVAVVLRGLPPPPAGRAYHVWLVGSKPLLVGALTPARDNLEVLLTDAGILTNGHNLRVSLEATGSTSPGGASLAAGTY